MRNFDNFRQALESPSYTDIINFIIINIIYREFI